MQMQDVTGLIARASTDAAIRTDLIKNPRAALGRVGLAIPDGVAINVLQNDASTFHAILPQAGNEQMMAYARAVNPTAAKVYERAWQDAAFKQRLLTSPRQAFVEATGITPPTSLRLIAHEDTPQQMNIVIPYVAPSGELSDADLEQVAGGKHHHHQSDKCTQNEATTAGVAGEVMVDATVASGGTGAGVALVGGGVAVGIAAIASSAK
jgi:hypothetical protein